MRAHLSLLASSIPIGLLIAPPGSGAVPDVPEQVSYQGVLLDDVGDPRTGSVDLTLRLYDALSGGTLIYLQHFLTVPLTSGDFSDTDEDLTIGGPNPARVRAAQRGSETFVVTEDAIYNDPIEN